MVLSLLENHEDDEQSAWSEQEFSFEEHLQYNGSIYILCEEGDFCILLNAVDDELYFSKSEILRKKF
jgi:hypothetical protein